MKRLIKKALFLLIAFLCVIQGYAQANPSEEVVTVDLGEAALSPEQIRKMEAALEVADAVEKAGNYIKSSMLPALSNSRIPDSQSLLKVMLFWKGKAAWALPAAWN